MVSTNDSRNNEPRQFDLNIEKVLEHWTMAHALREIIANALDEQAITNTAEPQIARDGAGKWHIRDFGRGLRYEHLTQNESDEKLKFAGKVIGKFGVGLKDALASTDRHGIAIAIKSRHGDITIRKVSKHGFSDVVTLHAVITAPSEPHIVGTDFVLSGLTSKDVAEAKGFFLRYSGDALLEETRYGSVLRRRGGCARIYVNGLCVAEEEKFLFSYNITSLTVNLRKSLNRERTNVGRSAYQDRIKAILLECSNSSVADALAMDLKNFETGEIHDELQWVDVGLHACRILNANEKIVFVTSAQLLIGGSAVVHAKSDGFRIIVVPQNIALKLPMVRDISGNPVRDLSHYIAERNDSFEFKFIPPEALSLNERSVFNLTQRILQLGGKHRTAAVKHVLISETMRLDSRGDQETIGLWEDATGRIIVKRSELRMVRTYAAVLLHEITHAHTGADDVTQKFEQGLTEMLGAVAVEAIVTGNARNG